MCCSRVLTEKKGVKKGELLDNLLLSGKEKSGWVLEELQTGRVRESGSLYLCDRLPTTCLQTCPEETINKSALHSNHTWDWITNNDNILTNTTGVRIVIKRPWWDISVKYQRFLGKSFGLQTQHHRAFVIHKKSSEHHVHVRWILTSDAKQSRMTQIKQWSPNRKQHLHWHDAVHLQPDLCHVYVKPQHYWSTVFTSPSTLSLRLTGRRKMEKTFRRVAFYTQLPHQKLSNAKSVSTSRTLEVISTEANSLYL